MFAPFSGNLALARNDCEYTRKHTWYFNQVRKTSLQSVQEMKISLPFQTIWLLHQITANARKHTWYFNQVVRKTSLQSVQEIKISLPFRAIWLLHQIPANARYMASKTTIGLKFFILSL